MVSNKPGSVELRSADKRLRARKVSSDDDLVGWKLIDSSAIVDELVTLLPPHSTFPAESLEVLNAAKLLLGRLKKAKNELEDNTDSGKETFSDKEKDSRRLSEKRRSSSTAMSASNASRTHRIKPEELLVKRYIIEKSKNSFNDSSACLQTQGSEQAESVITKADSPKRTFYGYYKENWKVGARVDLQHNFDFLPSTVARVHLTNMHDEYDVQLDNGDVVCNVRADSLRTMGVIPERLPLLLLSIAVILMVIFVIYYYETTLSEMRSSRRTRWCADYSDIVF